jgi:hypothetical protein
MNHLQPTPFMNGGAYPHAHEFHIYFIMSIFFLLSHVWLPTVQEVLHADWHDAAHLPQLSLVPALGSVFTGFLMIVFTYAILGFSLVVLVVTTFFS